jgi:phospholipid transport system transporter-binding protein
MLNVEKQALGEVVIWRCSGALVRGADLDHFQEVVTAEAARHMVLDLEEIQAMDAAGLGVLVYLHHWSLQSGVQLAIANMSCRVRSLLELTNLESILPVESVPHLAASAAPLYAA